MWSSRPTSPSYRHLSTPNDALNVVSCTSRLSGSRLSATKKARSINGADVAATTAAGVPTVLATNVGAGAAAAAWVGAAPLVGAAGVAWRQAARMPASVLALAPTATIAESPELVEQKDGDAAALTPPYAPGTGRRDQRDSIDAARATSRRGYS